MSANTATKKAAAKTAETKTPAKNAAPTANVATAEKGDQQNGKQKQTPFEKLFEDLLKDIYWAEQQLVTALKEMNEAATTEDLKDAFEDHLHVTEKHVKRLEQVFSLIGVKAEAKKCDAMEGLLKEGKRIIQETKEGTMTRDAGLIISAQKVEHYEISGYGTVRTFAQAMGQREVAQLLDQTLKEEEATDKKLTQIAKTLYKEAQRAEKSMGQESGNGGGRSQASSRGSASSRKRSATVEVEGMEEEEIEA